MLSSTVSFRSNCDSSRLVGIMGDQSASTGTAQLPKKRSLFNKPTWLHPDVSKEAISMFSRAQELWPERIAEEEAKRTKKLEVSNRKRTSDGDLSEHEDKRREIPNSGKLLYIKNSHIEIPQRENEDVPSSISNEPPALTVAAEAPILNPDPFEMPSVSASAAKTPEKFLISGNGNTHTGIPELTRTSKLDKTRSVSTSAGDPSVKDTQPSTSFNILYPNKEADGDELSDEEFPELVRAARQRQQQKATQLVGSRKHVPDLVGLPDIADDVFQENPLSDFNSDPTVHILVTSKIEGAKPLVVRRKLSQRLKEVRLAWCDRQLFMDQEMRDSIILIWNGKRLFDVTTCSGIPALMRRVNEGQHLGHGESDERSKVHMEAMTYEQYGSLQQRGFQQNGEPESLGGLKTLDSPLEIDDGQKIGIKLISRDLDALNVIVGPTTCIEKIINSFRKAKNIPAEKKVTLLFDGELLDPDSNIKDTELEELDTIEVVIR